MAKRSMSIVVSLGLVVGGSAAADSFDDVITIGPETRPPGEVIPTSATPAKPHVSLARGETDAGLWGGGVRLTGLSGIGALPGRNIGGEVAVLVRHDELFGEFALGRWKPEKTYVVVDDTSQQRVELGLDVWSFRGGWQSRTKPLRGWLLAEVGELASPDAMIGAVPRMVTMTTPSARRWVAVGAGFGVAWPMSDHARLVGTLELAVPVDRKQMMLEAGAFEPDPAAARCALGLEVGWR